MRIFTCPACGGDLFFDNLSCACGCDVAFDPKSQSFVSGGPTCANRGKIQCNWLADNGADLCTSCAMTAVHPDLAVPGNAVLWARAETAKRRVLVGLNRWGWFGAQDDGPRPEFHMLSEATSAGPTAVTMGHESGLVTINLAESDIAERVRRREELGEPYRTLVGHFRHEIAHFLFERLAVGEQFKTSFRSLFGDETADYAQALGWYYESGPPTDWRDSFISGYASAHPHEDWAESTAHAMHLADMVDSFCAAHLSMPDGTEADYDAYSETDASRLLHAGLRIGVAMNHVNRAMGIADLYPFVTPPKVIEKIQFAHHWLRCATGSTSLLV